MPTISLPSIQSLWLEMHHSGQKLSTGTGFIANSSVGSVLITNWHNITGRNPRTNELLSPTGAVPDEIAIAHNRKGRLGEWVIRTEQLFSEDRKRWVEHPTLGKRVDCVALPLTQLNDVELYPSSLGKDDRPIAVGPAETISVVGFPFGIRAGGSLAVWATGFVASEPEIDYDQLPIFLIDCRTRPGQSGSTVIAYRPGGMVSLEDGSSIVASGPIQRFLGIYSGRINDQSDLGIVWKASAIRQLVESIK